MDDTRPSLGSSVASIQCYALIVSIVLVVGADLASAQPGGGEPLAPSVTSEILTTSVATAALIAGALVANDWKPEYCRWCDRSENGLDTLNALDRSTRDGLLWSGSGARRADALSDVLQYTVWGLPAVLVSTSPSPEWSRRDTLTTIRMVVWASTANLVATSALKSAFARERPLVHFMNDEAGRASNENASFPSGHASGTFASVFAASQACRRLGCGRERLVWLIGVPAASFTGYLRIAADRHYLTDVLAGAGLGAAIGWLTPKVYDSIIGRAGQPSIRPVFGEGVTGGTATWVW